VAWLPGGEWLNHPGLSVRGRWAQVKKEVSNGKERIDSGPSFLLSLHESSGTLKKLAGSSLKSKGMRRSGVFIQHEIKLESSS